MVQIQVVRLRLVGFPKQTLCLDSLMVQVIPIKGCLNVPTENHNYCIYH